MLTPVFSCRQDDDFVQVQIVLSAICKAMEAVFDINGRQFTFYCSPYYLRLRFNQGLQEGRGEHATYDLDTHTLTVWLPKAVPGEAFDQLDNPFFLISTEKERRHLVAVEGSPVDEEEEQEEEFVQTLHRQEDSAGSGVSYGFGNHFSGLFMKVDPDVVAEMVAVPLPDITTPEERRSLRIAKENADFDEESVLLSFEDEDGEVASLLRYVPLHMRNFQEALQSDNIVYATLQPTTSDAHEVEEETLMGGGRVELWRGNIAEFKRPLIEEIDPAAATQTRSTPMVSSHGGAAEPRTKLAIPRRKPLLTFTTEENDTLIRVKAPRLLFQPSATSVMGLTADILFAEAYDDLATEGAGCSESLWNVVSLSSALSYLDPADNLYDACVFFARRLLVYPLFRHFAVAHRVFAVVGTRLLLGRNYVVRALLRVRSVLSHAEHKHVLATIFLDPLIAYWMNLRDADAHLTAMALEVHEHIARTQPVLVSADARCTSLLVQEGQRKLQPITVLTLGLPFGEE